MARVQQFTAARIAEKIGKRPRVVRRWLASVKPDGNVMVRGNVASVWKVESLPARLQQELTAATAGRFRSIEDFLAGPGEPTPSQIPWNEICKAQQIDSLTLQRALLPLIERRNDTSIAVHEFETLGVQTYERETGKQITRERWRYLFDRTLERDKGSELFHRPELFLSGNLRKANAPAPRGNGAADFEPLNVLIGNFHDPQNPTGAEIDGFWMEVIELFGELCETSNPKKLKRSLLEFLFNRAPFLASSAGALRRNFDRKLKAFEQDDDTAMLDGRDLKRGESRASEIPQPDIDRIAWHSARNCGNRTAQAVRELAAQGERAGLSQTTLSLITAPHARKSHVNRRLFSAVHPDVKLIAPYLLGKKAKDDATPSLRRDYSKLRSMTMLTADDFTMPVYMYVPDGKGWWILTRGQCLLMIDVRSLKIIGWSLQPERNYNALVIRTLMNQTCRKWGLPRVWYFENGIWRNAHLVKGAPREWQHGKSWGELKPGWARLGVKFIHAKKARSKPAELVGGLLQNLMERMPGYCGRDERRDCPEDTKRNKLAVEARRIEPHGTFLSFDAWHDELGKLIDAYNHNVQEGSVLRGKSPDQAFESFWPHNDPPIAFDASCWHLLAHYVSERTVGVDGITFKIGNQPFVYRAANSSALRGRSVLSWFDPETPEVLGVTDLNGRNPQMIPRDNAVDVAADLDSTGASGKVYREELAKVAGHNSYPKARYKILSAKFQPTFRQNFVAPGTSHVAETFQAGRAQLEESRREKSARVNTRVKRARKLGLQVAAVSGDELADEGMEMMLRAEHEQETKDYVLDPQKKFVGKSKPGAAAPDKKGEAP
ncbi:MAG: Bacteriophage Mu transposase [Verrucomicrobiota bacterium]|jgi:hypothetical protein